jgi:hypothetical protein
MKKLLKKSFTLHTHGGVWVEDMFGNQTFFDKLFYREGMYPRYTRGLSRSTAVFKLLVLLTTEIFHRGSRNQVWPIRPGLWLQKRMHCAERSAQASGHVYAFLVCDYFTLKYYKTHNYKRCGGTAKCLENIFLLVSFQYMEQQYSFKSSM